MNSHVNNTPKTFEEILSTSWGFFIAQWKTHVIAGIILSLLGAITFGLAFPPLMVGYIRMIERQVRGERIEAADIFQGFSFTFTSLIASLIFLIGVFLGMVCLIIPGIILAYGWSYSLWNVALNNDGAWSSLTNSWSQFRRHMILSIIMTCVMWAFHLIGGTLVIGFVVSVPLATILQTITYIQCRDT